MDKADRGSVYRSYLTRDGPTQLGSMEWPSPVDSALTGKRFVITGIFETITREDLSELITKCGGRVMKTMPKKLDYLVVGRDAGPSKLQKAEKDGIETLDELQCHDFLSNLSA